VEPQRHQGIDGAYGEARKDVLDNLTAKTDGIHLKRPSMGLRFAGAHGKQGRQT
ncbi:MAG: hypothetical protein JRF52_13935, partial [Deltaproteobacteria bacterium]|nr:hypothetical protein [Deltaproteobacteria bacterium]